MKITDVRTHIVNAGRRNLLLVRVLTDDDLEGAGEAYSVGPDLATAQTIDYLKDWLIGEDPTNIEHLWAKLYNFSRFPGGSILNAALSGIEHALWDLAARAVGLPVHKMLGGKTRDRVRVYQNPGGHEPEQAIERALALKEAHGYTAFKIGYPADRDAPFARQLAFAERKMRLLREALGEDVEIAVDLHAKLFEPFRARQMIEVLEPYRPLFVEEPTRPENPEALTRLARKVNVTLATGECLYTKYEFRELIAEGAVDIVQPDICLVGGFLETKKIAAMAEAAYMTVAPHNPMGPLATLINVHLAACIPNFLILEYHHYPELNEALLSNPVQVHDGFITVPDTPGWGATLNHAALEQYPYQPWRRAFVYQEDGAIGHV